MSPAVLPDEVWGMVVANLRKADIKLLSSTSRHYRSLTLPKLFDSLPFYFGTYSEEEEYDEEDMARIRRTRDVVRKIAKPEGMGLDFAHMVREARVIIVAKRYLAPRYTGT